MSFLCNETCSIDHNETCSSIYHNETCNTYNHVVFIITKHVCLVKIVSFVLLEIRIVYVDINEL